MVKLNHRSRRPLVRRAGKLDLPFNSAVHAVGMGRGDVVLDDDLRVRIQALDAADEPDGVARVFGRVRSGCRPRKKTPG